MTSPILLTGGTGTLGRLVTPLLREAGHDVRVLTRSPRPAAAGVTAAAAGVTAVTGDLTTGAGVDAAVAGVATIVHCAGTRKGDDDKARTLVAAARAAGTPHVVFISVVGADRIPVTSAIDRAMFGYFAAKRAAEQVISESGLPWTTLRATQFHDLVLVTVRGLVKMPVALVPAGVRFQPIDAGEVAARLAALALGPPSGLVPEIGGPRVYGLDELVRSYLATVGKRRPILRVGLPGAAARAVRAGANLTERAVGRRTWAEFLTERLAEGRREVAGR